MRKDFIKCLFIISTIGLLFTGCSSGTDNTPAEKDKNINNTDETVSNKVELKIWAGEEDKDYIATVTKNFIEENKDKADITIEWSPMVEGNCRAHLLGDVLNGPDVYTTTDGDLQSIVAGGAAAPVIEPDEIKSANLEPAVNAMTINDTIYGYPITADNGYFLYYNKEYLSENDVKTLDKILSVASQNNKKFAMDFSSGWYLYSFYGQTGLKLGLNEDGVTNFCDWNSTENSIKGTDVANALMAIGRNKGFKNTGEWIDGIKKGEIIACVSGVWDESTIKAEWGENYAASKLPTYTCKGQQIQMSCYFGYKMLGVNPYSKNLEWAHKLAYYISNEENQKLRFEIRGQGPSNINAGNSPEVKQAQAVQAVIEQSEYSELQRLGTNFWEPATDFGNQMAKGSIGKQNLQEILDKMVKKITASNVD